MYKIYWFYCDNDKSNDYTTGFINVTKSCQLGNKNYKHWLELKKSKEFNNKIDLILSGIYIHKQLILNISIWILNEFYDKVSNIIENHLIKNFKDELSLNKNKLEELNIEIEKYNKIIEDNCITKLEDFNKVW